MRYVYADPDVCTCVYVGDEQQYEKYQKLKVQKEIAERQDRDSIRARRREIRP